MSGYPYHPIKIERDEETGALRCMVTVNLFEEYTRMIDRGIAEQGEAAMDAALEAHGYTKERIVRCKDCKRVTIDQGDHDYREPLWCGLHRMDVCLNGFCAWGERKAAE